MNKKPANLVLIGSRFSGGWLKNPTTYFSTSKSYFYDDQ